MLIAAGIFAFVNKNTNKMEIVSLQQQSSLQEVDLGKGRSLLGASKYDFQVDEHKILRATNGNIDLIKIMCILNSLDPDLLRNIQVNKIASYNIWQGTGTETYNETILYNFRELCRVNGIKCNLSEMNFSSTLQSTVSQIRDICGEEMYKNVGEFALTLDPNDIVSGAKIILEKMDWLRKHDRNGKINDLLSGNVKSIDLDDEYVMAYYLLGLALNKLNGYNVYIEKDPGAWLALDKRTLYTGTMINSPGQSPSLNIQTVGQIMGVAETHIAAKTKAYAAKVKKAFTEFYEFNHRNNLIGGEVKYFNNLFVKDENGNIDRRFILRNPNDPNLMPAEANLIKTILEIFNELKGNPYTPDDDQYYQVPLAMASKVTKRQTKGVIATAKDHIKNHLNFMRLFPQQEADYSAHQRNGIVYNKYKIDEYTRGNLLAEVEIEEFETQLENLLWDYIVTFKTEEVMTEFLPRIQAIKVATQYMAGMFGVKVDNINQYIDDYVNLNIYNKPIMEENLVPIYRFLGPIKDMMNGVAMGFNVRSGIREMVSGI